MANAVVRVYRVIYGRGPTKARAEIDGELLTVTLEDIWTPLELTLLDAGHPGHVTEGRRLARERSPKACSSAVQRYLDRPIRAEHTVLDAERGVAVETFELAG